MDKSIDKIYNNIHAANDIIKLLFTMFIRSNVKFINGLIILESFKKFNTIGTNISP